MAIFYPPPQPHVGGRQPLEPPRLAPAITAVPVDDPPFASGLRSPALLYAIRFSWEPAPPLPWIGRFFTQGAAIPADDPPFTISPQTLYALRYRWEPAPPLPWLPRYLPQGSLTGADTAPFSRTALWTIVQCWQRGFDLPEAPAYAGRRLLSPAIPGMSVDNPPAAKIALPSIALWPGAPPLVLPRNLSPAIPGMSIDPPPLASTIGRSTIVDSWQMRFVLPPRVTIFTPGGVVIAGPAVISFTDESLSGATLAGESLAGPMLAEESLI